MSTNGSGNKKPASFGEKLKGAAHVVHGLGEDIRGSVMGAFETISGSDEAKAKDEDIAAKGKAEIERGVAQMKGVDAPSGTTAAATAPVESKTGGQPQEQPAKAAPGTTQAPPPSPAQTRVAEPETSRQEPTGQTGTESVPKGSQETQPAAETKAPETVDKDPIGQSADTPQAPSSKST